MSSAELLVGPMICSKNHLETIEFDINFYCYLSVVIVNFALKIVLVWF